MAATAIEWTDATWNPVTGCTKISAGCAHCYAERMARRLQAMGNAKYSDGFAVRCHPETLAIPLRWRKPRMVFVNSMGDLFHKSVPLSFIQEVFAVMNEARQHKFQLLTKRSRRLMEIAGRVRWTPNIWAGVTVESEEYLGRLDHLRRVPAAIRFVSFEPLLGPIPEFDLSEIDWVIAGGETGPGARPMQEEWAMGVLTNCHEYFVPFFFKQWGGASKKAGGCKLGGLVWHEFPREFERRRAVEWA